MTHADPVHGSEADRWGGWTWRPPARGEHYRTCSYCGSINGDDLAAESAWSPSWTASWADWKYGWPHKFYVNIINQNPSRLFCIGSANHEIPGWVSGDELTSLQRRVIAEYGMLPGERWYQFGTREFHHAKFYTVHYADPSMRISVRETLQRISGLRITFTDMIRWEEFS